MQLMANGRRYPSGARLLEPLEEERFAAALLDGLGDHAAELTALSEATATAATYGEVVRPASVDVGDPRAAGWTYLIRGDDPDADAIAAAIEPLARRRGVADAGTPLRFGGERHEDWFQWLLENYTASDGPPVPHYVLIVGGPERVPFNFQAFLQSVAAVGRLAFESLDDLRAYVDKVIRIEDADEPVVEAESVFFAPDEGPSDPTYFSRVYMAEPLAKHVADKRVCDVRLLAGEQASKAGLAEAVSRRPALVYTASHGVGATGASLAEQRQLNGAICCQEAGGAWSDSIYAGADVPSDARCIEGGILFQFACYGYGTPAESDYGHWLGETELNSEADFVSALPTRLLAHPEGPVAYVGHVDTAWLHGFDDPDAPHLLERWHPRIAPFLRAVDGLLETQPVGHTMAAMSERYDVLNAILTTVADRQRRGKPPSPGFEQRLADTFITRSDAQNYHVLGDPAVRLRIPTPN